jgi:CHAD domain-containing protein
MAYHLKRSESVPEGIRRIAGEELESAAGQLDMGQGGNQDEAIHEARKSVKKVRAVLRLVQGDLGNTYREESSFLRDAGRKLSQLRDAGAVIEILDALKQKSPNELNARTFDLIGRELLARKERAEKKDDIQKALGDIAVSLRAASKRVKAWPLQTDGFPAIAPGLRQTFRRGRRALARVQDCPRPENYHEWRKRVKDHWYHVRLLEDLWTDVMRAYEKSLNDVQTWLGDDHNLVLLREQIVAEPDSYGDDEEISLVLRLADKYQKDLRDSACSLGKRVYYEEKPRQFVYRMRRLWDEWQVEPESLEELQNSGHDPQNARARHHGTSHT